MDTIMTFDVGTTSVKVCLFDYKLNELCSSIVEYELETDASFVELSPETYIDSIKEGINKIKSKVKDAVIKAIASTTQGETLILVDKDGTPLTKAIVWLDARADREAKKISEKIDAETFSKKTGLVELNGAVPISKLMWIKENEKEIYDKTYKFLFLEDYIIYRLTGKMVSEKSLVTSSGYFDLETDDYYSEILDASEISKEKLPPLYECGALVSNVSDKASEEFGLPKETLVYTGAMDQVSSAVGAGALYSGIITETTGTALVVTSFAKKREYLSLNGITEYRHIHKGEFLNLAFSNTAGIVLKWFKDTFCRDLIKENENIYDTLGNMANDIAPLSDGLSLFPHFEGTNFPEVNLDAKGVYFGIGLNTKRAHFVRALFEGVAYMLRENIEKLAVDAKEIKSLGGASDSDVWSKIKADVTNKNFITYKGESTSRGVAILTLVNMGVFSSYDEAFKNIQVKNSYKPGENVKIYERGYERYINMYENFCKLF